MCCAWNDPSMTRVQSIVSNILIRKVYFVNELSLNVSYDPCSWSSIGLCPDTTYRMSFEVNPTYLLVDLARYVSSPGEFLNTAKLASCNCYLKPLTFWLFIHELDFKLGPQGTPLSEILRIILFRGMPLCRHVRFFANILTAHNRVQFFK
jgi:hypothetical protein